MHGEGSGIRVQQQRQSSGVQIADNQQKDTQKGTCQAGSTLFRSSRRDIQKVNP